ncbi:hypothetical protein [Amphritea sp. HPY]|uniref:hypothetical protein n=1 Tax=Amphritea sp. HPY TaxID=3421652 RepID=UPI003D7CC669
MANCSYCNGTGHRTVKNASGIAEFGGICTECGGSGIKPGTRYLSSINDSSSTTNQADNAGTVDSSSRRSNNAFSLIVGGLAGIGLFFLLGDEIKALFVGSEAAGFYLMLMAGIVISPLLLARFVPDVTKFISLVLFGAIILILYRMLV